ncbi:MAG: hypothetical protein EHM35_01450 [Planctomycetaceae bacterium]|nr:MAG: hypothetical protein EHM35_01450 [Planctomycetaceae bacterium]
MTWETALEMAGIAVDDLNGLRIGLIERVAVALLRASGTDPVLIAMLVEMERVKHPVVEPS